MKRSIHALWFTLPLMLSSCVSERPSDLTMEQVFVADVSRILDYGFHPETGKDTQHLRLVIELSTTESYPNGALVVDGFCGGKQGPGYLGGGGWLFRGTNSDRRGTLGVIDDNLIRYRYFVFVPIVYIIDRPYPEFPRFDLRNDLHDICIHTGAGTYADVWRSNEVRVPRSLIEIALHEPPRATVPLSKTQHTSPEPVLEIPAQSR